MSHVRVLTTALAMLALGVITASAQELAPGDYAGQSTRFNVASKYCKSLATMTPAGRDSAAKKFEALKEKEFREQVWDCHDPNWRAKSENESLRPASYRQRQRGGYDDNYAEVREYLRSYKGPLWKTRGPIRNRYMNRPAPESAVPCRPPGYRHTVLCNPR